jgi:hypothetical protein
MATQQPTGRAVLYVSSNVAPDVFDAFSNWCDTIHHFDTMRIEGFLSLRRFQLLDGVVDSGGPEFATLTLYQVEEPSNADFSTPAYVHHSATYTPPPDGVVDGITFDRTIYERDQPSPGNTQSVGAACVTLVGANGLWLDEAAKSVEHAPGVLNIYRVANDERSVLFVDVDDEVSGRVVLSRLQAFDAGAKRQSVQLFNQVYPTYGVLLRDRELRT